MVSRHLQETRGIGRRERMRTVLLVRLGWMNGRAGRASMCDSDLVSMSVGLTTLLDFVLFFAGCLRITGSVRHESGRMSVDFD